MCQPFFFFYENGSKSGTESQKMAPKVGNERYLRGLQTGRWSKLGSYGKNRILWPKTEILGQKRHSLLNPYHVLATTGNSCSKKKVAFSQINNSLLRNFGCFFWDKTHFWPKKHFSAKPKNGYFSVIPAQTESVVILGHFFDGPDSPTKFHWKRSKIRGTYTSEVGMA